MLRLLTLMLSCVAVCAQPVLSLNDPTVVAKSSSLLQGLVGYWQLEEASGTRYDRSPNGNHLTAVNSPGSATGKVGNCGTFTNSSSQYLTVANNSTLQMSNNFTMACWVYPTSTTQARYIVGKWANGVDREYLLNQENDNTINFWVRSPINTTNNNVISTEKVALNAWNFIVCWLDASGQTINVSVNSTNTSKTHADGCRSSTNAFQIAAYSNLQAYFDGRIDEVGLWNRVLTASERTKLYRSGLGVTYPRFSMRDNRADDFNWDTWEPIYDKPKPFPTLYAFVNRREPEPLLTICE